jgi:hypothetical protein
MADLAPDEKSSTPRGCLFSGVGAVVLALFSPFVLAVRGWRAWRRGSDIRATVDVEPVARASETSRSRLDLKFDVPLASQTGFRKRLTEAVIRVAEALRSPDDVYHVVYRLPWDEDPVALPVGPQLQELGERFSLVLSQASLEGRTVVWLTLAGHRSLAEVLDPVSYDPEGEGEPERLMTHTESRWSMATEWAGLGPSLVFRLVLVVPSTAIEKAKTLLSSVR